MFIIVIFGLPGSGKTYVGHLIEREFGYYFHDADLDLPKVMKTAIDEMQPISDEMRDNFFENVTKTVRKLTETHDHIVISQTFVKEKYRANFLKEFPEADFVMVFAGEEVRKKRLTKRLVKKERIEYFLNMSKSFEEPGKDVLVIENSIEGESFLISQLKVSLFLD